MWNKGLKLKQKKKFFFLGITIEIDKNKYMRGQNLNNNFKILKV